MLKGMKVFCIELEGTSLLDGVVYQIENFIISNDGILVKVNNCDKYFYMSRFEKAEDVINVSIERGIDIKEAIRVFL